jgi:hypothetical protein
MPVSLFPVAVLLSNSPLPHWPKLWIWNPSLPLSWPRFFVTETLPHQPLVPFVP